MDGVGKYDGVVARRLFLRGRPLSGSQPTLSDGGALDVGPAGCGSRERRRARSHAGETGEWSIEAALSTITDSSARRPPAQQAAVLTSSRKLTHFRAGRGGTGTGGVRAGSATAP